MTKLDPEIYSIIEFYSDEFGDSGGFLLEK